MPHSLSQSLRRLFLPATNLACLATLCSFQPTALAQSCLIPPTNMIAWWSADGHTVDITGLGHNGTLVNGATYGPGEVGQAFSFNGTTAYVQVPKSTTWDLVRRTSPSICG